MTVSVGDVFQVVGARSVHQKIVTRHHINICGDPDGWCLERHVIDGVEVSVPHSWEREATLLDPTEYWKRSSARPTAHRRPLLRSGPNFFAGAGFYWKAVDGRVLRAEDFTDQHLANAIGTVFRMLQKHPVEARWTAAYRVLCGEWARRDQAALRSLF